MKYIAPFGSIDPDAPYVDRNTSTATRGSAVPADFFNIVQAEILAVIEAAGLDPSASAMQLGQAIQSGLLTFAVAGGTANALTATLSPAPAVLRAGMRIAVKATANNTGAMTLNVNGLGAVAIMRMDGTETAAGDAVIGGVLPLVFDGANWFVERWAGFLPLSGGIVTGPITLPGPPTEDLHATTRAYVDHPGYVAVSAATTLTVSQLRKFIEISGSGGYTVTLPAPNVESSTGGMYFIYNASASDKVLATPAGSFLGPKGTTGSTMVIPRGAFVWIICGYANWIAVEKSYDFIAISSAATLAPSAIGSYHQLSGASTYTVTLLNPASFSGAEIEFYNSGSVGYTLATPSGSFVGPKGSGGSTMVIAAGEYITLRAGNLNWIAH